ncbi:hypothetical protein V6Z11_D11G323200 [Gossypium hirsutum]
MDLPIKFVFSMLSISLTITAVKLHGSSNYEVNIVDEKSTDSWAKLDAQLYSLLWHSLEPKLITFFQSCKTSYKIWTKAKNLYTKDIQHIYKVVSNFVHLQQNQLDMTSYLGQVESLKDEFSVLMPLTENVADQEKQRDKFFMVLLLIGS